jgi:hypothetical protein
LRTCRTICACRAAGTRCACITCRAAGTRCACITCRTTWAGCANGTCRTLRASRAYGTCRAIRTTRACRAIGTAGTCRAVRATGTCYAIRATRTRHAIRTARAGRAIRATGTRCAICTCRTAGTSHSVSTCRSTGTCCAIGTSRTHGTGFTLRTGRTFWTLGSLVAGDSRRAGGAFGTARALLALQDIHIFFGVFSRFIGKRDRIKSLAFIHPGFNLGKQLRFDHRLVSADDFQNPGKGRVVLRNQRHFGNAVAIGFGKRTEILPGDDDPVSNTPRLSRGVAHDRFDYRGTVPGIVVIVWTVTAEAVRIAWGFIFRGVARTTLQEGQRCNQHQDKQQCQKVTNSHETLPSEFWTVLN